MWLPLRAVIFDYSVLLANDSDTIDELRTLMLTLRSRGLKLVGFSTHPQDIHTKLEQRKLPALDLWLTRADVQVNKRSPRWVLYAAATLGIQPTQFLYVGDDDEDWITAIQGGAVYLHASWSKPLTAGTPVVFVTSPTEVYRFATQFLLVPPRWEFQLNVPEERVIVRCLTEANTQFTATTQDKFRLHDVFKVDHIERPDIKSDFAYVGELLVLHALMSLLQEGLLDRNSFYTNYPSSTPGKQNIVLKKFVEISAKLFKDYYREDIFTRFAQAPDTSMERYNARARGKIFPMDITTQANTICINDKYRLRIRGRNIVVFDDFMTTGTSLEWARNLLIAAGASQVVLVTMGKYPGAYRMYTPRLPNVVAPFVETSYDLSAFEERRVSMTENTTRRTLLQELFGVWKLRQPFEDYLDEYNVGLPAEGI